MTVHPSVTAEPAQRVRDIAAITAALDHWVVTATDSRGVALTRDSQGYWLDVITVDDIDQWIMTASVRQHSTRPRGQRYAVAVDADTASVAGLSVSQACEQLLRVCREYGFHPDAAVIIRYGLAHSVVAAIDGVFDAIPLPLTYPMTEV